MKQSFQSNCLICKTLEQIKKNDYFVYELTSGFVIIADNQFYRGYTIFLSKKHKTELHFLPNNFAIKYLKEMMLVAKSVWDAFRPLKLNYELLGNTEPHLHWHIIPRYKNDPNKSKPIWSYKINQRNKFKLTRSELEKIKNKLKVSLIKNNK